MSLAMGCKESSGLQENMTVLQAVQKKTLPNSEKSHFIRSFYCKSEAHLLLHKRSIATYYLITTSTTFSGGEAEDFARVCVCVRPVYLTRTNEHSHRSSGQRFVSSSRPVLSLDASEWEKGLLSASSRNFGTGRPRLRDVSGRCFCEKLIAQI